MMWKVIGQSVIGSSHIQSGKTCEDAVAHAVIDIAGGGQALICFVSDGAGSALYAEQASQTAVALGVSTVAEWLDADRNIDEAAMIELVEVVYDRLAAMAAELETALNEFSCTLLGSILMPEKACFLQIGDGAIIRDDGNGNFTYLWWPHNGEYQNTTAFVVDDINLRNLKTRVVDEAVAEVALFTDGLQMLALNNEAESVYQPFFTDLFKVLRMATSEQHIGILNNRLAGYLSGEAINSRTDDDKTLLLATRLGNGGRGL